MQKDLDKKRVDAIIRFALKEDIWTGDVTSKAVIDRFHTMCAVIVSRSRGIVCGMDIAERVFAAVEYSLQFRPMVADGDRIGPGQEIAFIEGEAQSILMGERTALNFLGMLSGVATKTRRMVDAAEGSGVKIYDTRKTIPLHRYLEKYAVTVGGGHNHRKGLWDMILIKDNHLRAFSMQIKESGNKEVIQGILKRARHDAQKNIKIEIEVETVEECGYALDERPDVIMLDNMTPEKIKKAVAIRKEKGLEGKVLFEISGGITLDNIKDYAGTGAEIISTGSITGAIEPLDFSMETVLRK
ncbi:MAG: carboxylating nicotinate-nucleotide diphosphorylase [Candidatus Omnitrophota bacterium]|nr:carboxylating nicotinate-nucleotide diphosphorylase [Candidatus Omnitrophota bacterium]